MNHFLYRQLRIQAAVAETASAMTEQHGRTRSDPEESPCKSIA